MESGYNTLAKIETMVASAKELLHEHLSLQKLLYSDFAEIPIRINEPMQLAIIGRISSSKSTLVNAILGEAEVVRTGAMEETWNVSWLKYGDPKSDIIVHFKNGTVEAVARDQWAEWANRERHEGDELKNSVSYIEVAYEHEMLKSINIIDTPGLDSFYGADSQNTLDFLKQVRPDAVIMLFSKSINADTLSVIEDFRQGIGAGFSPINTLGVMSKIDDIWASDPELDPLTESKRVIAGLMQQDIVKQSLFNILPISAFVALSSFQLTNKNILTIRQLTVLDEEVSTRIFKSAKRFVTDYEDVSVPAQERKELLSKYGMYGVWLIMGYLKTKPNATDKELASLLVKKSGYDSFIELLTNHFGSKTALIKIYSLIFALSSKCHKYRFDFEKNSGERLIIDKLIKKVDELIRILAIDFAVIGVSKSYYEGTLDIDENDFYELRRVNGEFGCSCIHRAGLEENASIQEIESKILARIAYWTTQYNSKGLLFPSEASFMKLMISTYSLLLNDIISAKYRLASTTKFLFGK